MNYTIVGCRSACPTYTLERTAMANFLGTQTNFYEDLEDRGLDAPLDISELAGVVLNTSDWTTETILSQMLQGNIDLNPRFQRRDAWPKAKKSRFIESLIMGLPIPQLVLAEKKNIRGKFIVLDGKQRLLSILQFTGNGAAGSKNNNFKLSGLDALSDLNRKSYSDLKKPQHLNEFIQFNNQTIRTIVIRNWPSSKYLELVFLRLNSTSSALSPQELRQAIYPGPFVDFADDSAGASAMLRNFLRNNEPDFRMRDVEILVRFIAFSCFISDYKGNMKDFLDNACDALNKKWEEKSAYIHELVENFNESLALLDRIFTFKNLSRKYTRAGYESLANRAVLDAFCYYFRFSYIRDAALGKEDAIREAYEDLCVNDNEFLSAVESTTKSIESTYLRISRWGQKLRQVLDIDLRVPTLSEHGRIVE